MRVVGASLLVYERRKADAEFAAAWDDSLVQGTDLLEDEALRRAMDGVAESGAPHESSPGLSRPAACENNRLSRRNAGRCDPREGPFR